MYKDDQISLAFLNQYDKLVSLLKEKVAASSKLSNLQTILEYFDDNYEMFNKEEKKLVKNIIIMANGITNKTNTYYNFIKNQKELCLTLIENLSNKQKEPTK